MTVVMCFPIGVPFLIWLQGSESIISNNCSPTQATGPPLQCELRRRKSEAASPDELTNLSRFVHAHPASVRPCDSQRAAAFRQGRPRLE